MGEVKDDERSFTITLMAAPDLKIIDYIPPTELEEGEEVKVPVTIRNDGADCKYKIKLVQVNPYVLIDEEPNTYLIGDTIRTGETKTKEVNTVGWWGAMPNHDWDLRVEVWHET